MTAAAAGLVEAVLGDPRHAAGVGELRRRWAAADAAFHAMVEATASAQQWLATRTGMPRDDRGERTRVAARLVALETEALRARSAVYAAAIRLTADVLEAVAATHGDTRVAVEGTGEEPDTWVALVLRHLAAMCQAADSPVALV